MGRFITMGSAPIAYQPAPSGQHGTHDDKGQWHQQRVHLGMTRGGQPGLFTGSLLAWPMRVTEYTALRANRAALKAYAERAGFALDD